MIGTHTVELNNLNAIKEFKMKDLGEHFPGIDFTQSKNAKKKRYITKILERFGLSDCKIRSTP